MTVSTLDAGDGTRRQISGLTPPAAAFDSAGAVTSVTPTNTGAAAYELLIDTGSGYVSQASGLTEAQLAAYTIPSLSAGTYPAKIVATYAAWSVEYVGSVTITAAGNIIFSDSFDSQADRTSDDTITANDRFSVLSGWTVARYDSIWSPASPDPLTGRHPVVEVLAANPGEGGTGKYYRKWRDSFWRNNGDQWNSDGTTTKVLDKEYQEIFIEYSLNFSAEMIATYYAGGLGQSKLVRAYYQDLSLVPATYANPRQGDPSQYFQAFGDANKPDVLMDISGDTTYGVRNFLSIYARGPNDIRSQVQGIPSGGQLQSGGDLSLWYSNTATGALTNADGSSVQLPDYKNGGFITSGPVNIDQVFGDQTVWVKCRTYVKNNSAPGIADGKITQWMVDQNGKPQKISELTNIPFCQTAVCVDSTSGFNVGDTITGSGGQSGVISEIDATNGSTTNVIWFQPSTTQSGYTANQFALNDTLTNGTATATVNDLFWQEIHGFNAVAIGGNDFFHYYDQHFTFDGTAQNQTIAFPFAASTDIIISDVTASQYGDVTLTSGTDYTISGTTVSFVANASLSGHVLCIHKGYQEWYGIDSVVIRDSIPSGAGYV